MSAVLAIDEAPEFFAPSNSDALDVLLGQYRQARQNVERVARFMASDEMLAATTYFFEGNKERFHRYTPNAVEVFSEAAAIPALNAAYWQRALNLTDVLDYMPDKRRQEWFEHIEKLETPEFEEKTVRATLGSLLAQRMDFLAEMVDGIFRGLSGEHVTNRPEGFGKRMIIDGAYSEYGMTGRKAGLIHDLRSVIAKFMGRDQPHYGVTGRALEHFRKRPGEWHLMDGGALRVRAYKKGTAHLEVHPDMAWRLNQVLAHLHPMAIPARHRQCPAKNTTREFTLMQRPIPFAVLKLLSEARYHDRMLETGPRWGDADKHVKAEAVRVIEAIGGADAGAGSFVFDYAAGEVIGDVIASGMLPDHKSHQYYPTPRRLAEEAVRLAEIGPTHWCLEPSAGQGALADLLPKDRTRCVEASALHCKVLEAKGYPVLCGDFLRVAEGRIYDRIVMNPPFSEGRALAHIQHAATHLALGGRLVAILPASYAGKDVLPGLKTQWSRVYSNEFVGASVDVVILTADREAV
jgi:hypothetical protein